MRAYHMVSGTVFGLLALLQGLRAFNQWPVVVGGNAIPVAVSWVAFAVAGSLCVWAFRSRP